MSFANTEPIQIVEGVFLEPISRAEQRSRAMDWMATDVPAYLAAAATHALVFRNLSFDNPHHRGDWLTRGRQSQFDRSEIDLLFQSLYMKTGTASGYAQILVRPRGWAMRWTHDLPPMFTEWSGRRYPESLDEARLFRELRPLSIEETTSVAELFARLIRAPGNVKLAARRAYRISFRDEVEDQIIDAAIGIEALVGKDRDELTHRMSQRAAVALRGEFPPQNIYSLVKQLYTQRSVIVHGGIPKKTEVSLNERNMPATAMGDFLLRALLKDYLAADEPWTPETLDAMILSGLERDGGYPESVPED